MESPADAFDKTPDEMLDLAIHINDTKRGTFDPADFEDRYQAAPADLVKAKFAGRKIAVRPPNHAGKVVNLVAKVEFLAWPAICAMPRSWACVRNSGTLRAPRLRPARPGGARAEAAGQADPS